MRREALPATGLIASLLHERLRIVEAQVDELVNQLTVIQDDERLPVRDGDGDPFFDIEDAIHELWLAQERIRAVRIAVLIHND